MQRIFKDKNEFVESYRHMFKAEVGKDFDACTDKERFDILVKLIAVNARDIAAANEPVNAANNKKKVYYFSLEFLIGRLLDNYLLDFGVRDIVADGLEDMGVSLEDLCNQEHDAGLGNGGLGRLAACFLDSMAHEGIEGYGNGMRYRYGLFKQSIKDGRQVEETDNWLAGGYPWEVCRPESSVIVRFGGEVVRHEKDGKYWFTWEGGDEVKAVPYDVPIVGYGGETVNKLRIWSAEPVEEEFDLDAFNEGDYAKAARHRADVEAISEILYPNDSGEHGKILRLKQEYLFVAAGLASILRTYHAEYGSDWAHFPDRVAIHTNDTHPAMCGAELMRIFIDEEGLDWDTAWDIVTRSISYTNHTVMPEALEKWPINTFRTLLPRVYMYIDEIDRRYRESFPHTADNWQELLKKTAILWDGEVRMANLSIICSHSVNGVARIHTDILEHDVLKEFYALTPEKFNNKTNGVSHRRFLAESNPTYAKLITEHIGDHWLDDADDLAKLKQFEDDTAFLDAMAVSKRANKERLAAYIKDQTGVELDCDTVFDVQVKRFHAYKRQLLNVFKILDIYNRLLADPSYKPQPTSFIFSGKAAQSYDFAKEVIRLINSVADVINADERVNSTIKVAFVPNFAVSNAQLIYPAAEISEQISTAGKEASGTSNMKLMMNGAITLGTMDGANVEIAQLAGDDNIEVFGLRVEDVEALHAAGTYFSWDEYNNDRDRLGRVVDELVDGTFASLSGNFESIHDYLMQGNDPDLVFKDFRSYVDAWERLTAIYPDAHRWNRIALHNTATSGYFASDRTIREYAKEIWHAS
jgi:starch phosphorylase